MLKDFFVGKRFAGSPYFVILFLAAIIVSSAISVPAQAPPIETDAMQARIARARALTAAHNLTAAAFELDAIRNSTSDDMVRDVARIMLMGIYLEQADYGRAQVLLDETYKARSRQNEGSCRSYFTVAGQAINGLRSHIERFRAVGLNVGNKDLPTEAIDDLDRVRGLLEHVVEQAKEIGSEDSKNTDAFALVEDGASVRLSLSRDLDERVRWQIEMAEARQHLAASETRLASLSGGPGYAMPSQVTAPAQSTTMSTPVSTDSRTLVITKPKSTDGSKSTGAVASNDLSSSAAMTEPVNIGSLLEQAAQRITPNYPTYAKTARVTGVVRVDLIIDEKGSVLSAQSSSGPPVLRQPAIDAALRWKFRPVIRDGKPARVAGFLNFNFKP